MSSMSADKEDFMVPVEHNHFGLQPEGVQPDQVTPVDLANVLGEPLLLLAQEQQKYDTNAPLAVNPATQSATPAKRIRVIAAQPVRVIARPVIAAPRAPATALAGKKIKKKSLQEKLKSAMRLNRIAANKQRHLGDYGAAGVWKDVLAASLRSSD